MAATKVTEPLDLIRLSLDERISIKLRGERILKGKLHAYDQHLNMILSDVNEEITKTELNEETFEEVVSKSTRNHNLLFVRGDSVILVTHGKR